ncbi:MAG: hypothetical protein Q9160_000793 [Pyrenula sp. 1 TL-2023]
MSDSKFFSAPTPPYAFHSFHKESAISPPLSPLVSPLTTTGTTIVSPTTISISSTPLAPPPPSPLPWIWQCHVCRARWPLGATRRCLIDGHYYCSGQPQTRRGKAKAKGKKGRSCSSEFDYIGWKDCGRWRGLVKGPVREGCETECEFPSHCRYRKAGVGGPKAALEADKLVGETRAEEISDDKQERVKVKTLDEILKEAENGCKADEQKGKESGSKAKKKKTTRGTDVTEAPSSVKSKEKAGSKGRAPTRSQSMSFMMPSTERLYKLKEATERRIERSKGEGVEGNSRDQEEKATTFEKDKQKGKEKEKEATVAESGLQPFLLPVIEYLNRKVGSRTQEDSST